jgi:hypothetical protein
MRSEIAKEILNRPRQKRQKGVILNITDLQPSDVIRFVPIKEYTTNLRNLPVAKVVEINQEQNTINVEFPDGTKRVIEWIEFIIYILPLIEKIFFIIKGWFTKKK